MISFIPIRLPSLTTTAIFSNHNITVLPPRAFEGCSHLKSLDLSSGMLNKIFSASFATLYSLRSLSLKNNSLDFSQQNSVESNVFDDLINLLDLKLDLNQKSFIQETSIRNDLFAKTAALCNISVDFPDKVTLTGNVTWLLRLNKLEIFGTLKKVFNNTFAAINQTRIKYLGIHSQKMEDVDALAFAYLPYLEVLNLSNTQLLGFKNVSKAWYGLRYKPLKVLDLTSITSFDLELITIDSAFFNHLNCTNITDIYVDSNLILTVAPGILHGLPKLRTLSMTNNRVILFYDTWLEFSQLKHIRRVDGSYQLKRMMVNRYTTIPSHLLQKFTKQRKYRSEFLNYQNLKNKFNQEKDEPSSVHLTDYRHGLTPSMFVLKTFPIVLPRCLQEIKVVQISSEEIYTMPNLYILGYTCIRLFNYSNNGLSLWNSAIVIAIPPRNKITIDLSKNGCRQMSPKFFNYSCHYVDRLFLSYNQLGTSLAGDTNGELFRSCSQLIVLDLANNDIKLLPRNVFVNLPNLQYLNLSMNSLRTINITLNHTQHLKLLDISSNLLGFLGNDVLLQLKVMANLIIDLTDNPFICDCQSVQFLRWASKNKKRLRNFRYYQCIFNSDYNFNVFKSFEELDSIVLPSLTLRCNSSDYVKYVFFLATLLLFAILMVLCGKKYYWDIKFCLLDLSYRRRNYMRLIEQQQAERYKFAAFVAFEKGDRTWIDEQLTPALQTPDCKLFIYPEQFLSGYIEDNIMRGLQECHKVILVLSRHFVNSEWCLLEARMAFHRCLDTGFDLIIPILLEDISTEVMRKLVQP